MYKLAYAFILFTIILNCKYKPEGVKYVDVDPTNIGEDIPTINLSETTDTLFLPRPTYINFNIETDRRVYRVQVTINGKTISNEGSGGIYIDTEAYTTGYHSILFEVITSTETGSLADLTNNEVIQFSYEKTFFVDNDPPNQIFIKSIKGVDGRLNIVWEKYNRINFKAYYLSRAIGENGSFEKIISFNSQNDTIYIDKSVLDGFLQYRIDVEAYTGFAEGKAKIKEFNEFEIDIEIDNQNRKAQLTWNQPELYKNFLKYELNERSIGAPISYWASTNIDDTTLTLDITFGVANKYDFNAWTRYGISSRKAISITSGYRITDDPDFIGIQQIYYDKGLGRFFLRFGTKLQVINRQENNLIEEYIDPIDYFTIYDGDIYASILYGGKRENYIARIDLNSLEILEKIYPSEIAEIDNHASNLRINSNGIAIFNSASYQNPTLYIQDLFVYDLIEEVILGRYDNSSRARFYGDGIISIDDTLFRKKNQMLSSFAIVTEKPTQIYRINQNTLGMVYLTSQGFKIDSWNETTGSKIRTIYSNEHIKQFYSVNISNQTMAVSTETEFQVYDINDFTLLKRENIYPNYDGIFFLDNLIISPSGYYLEIE